jgi:hypothetical protein
LLTLFNGHGVCRKAGEVAIGAIWGGRDVARRLPDERGIRRRHRSGQEHGRHYLHVCVAPKSGLLGSRRVAVWVSMAHHLARDVVVVGELPLGRAKVLHPQNNASSPQVRTDRHGCDHDEDGQRHGVVVPVRRGGAANTVVVVCTRRSIAALGLRGCDCTRRTIATLGLRACVVCAVRRRARHTAR